MSKRNPHGEAAFLRAVGPDQFAQLVTRRLDEQEPEFGDTFAWMSLPAFWDELAAEPVDTAAWAVLLARRYELDGSDEALLNRIRGTLMAAAHHARQAHDLIAEARRLALEEAS
jgi:hypothetical protein